MDLQQRKLTKTEWDSIERPVSADESAILKLIMEGYDNINIRYNTNNNICTYLKMEPDKQVEDYLFSKYLLPRFLQIKEKTNFPPIAALDIYTSQWNAKTTIKKNITIKLQRHDTSTIAAEKLLENTLLELIEAMITNKYGKKLKKPTSRAFVASKEWHKQYVTMHKLLKIRLSPNTHVATITNALLRELEPELDMSHIIEQSAGYVEQNSTLLRYADMSLYQHQREIFTHAKQEHPKLIMYTAPTGTGKTLTPIGLLGGHKVIFMCAARHVGLALAKAALNMHKCVAFAFGCDTADDIRLHYFAAKDYTKDWRSGGIRKVDNSVGDKVELMICDIKSYLPAMYYMLAFNEKEKIVTYWDEPTITLDYESHECHDLIQKNWSKNIIPNMVLSSATLPKRQELNNTISDFIMKFDDPETEVIDVVSSDCRKSVPIVNKYGYIVSPHNISSDYDVAQKIVAHCANNPVLMRYFDLHDISNAILVANKRNYAGKKIERCFASVDDVTLVSIKEYYLVMLKSIPQNLWSAYYAEIFSTRKRIVGGASRPAPGDELRKSKSVDVMPQPSTHQSLAGSVHLTRTTSVDVAIGATGTAAATQPSVVGTYVSTRDSHTLTDGPTIYLSDEPEKIAKFCVQQANIPEIVLTDLLKSIEYNNVLADKIDRIERDLEDALPKESADSGASGSGGKKKQENTKKIDRLMTTKASVTKLKTQLETFRKMIRVTQLNDTFVPNKRAHLDKWAKDEPTDNAFTSTIHEDTIVKIMALGDVSNSWKILLMLGIGVFTNHKSVEYTEIMKQLADQQQLYLIIATSDYIYGTNYQFCHGYVSKNMNLTQEKIIQAIGRIGRNGLQQKYTIRFRDDEPIHKLFTHEEDKPEVANMNRLFNTIIV